MALGLFDDLPDVPDQSTPQQGATASLSDDLPDAPAPRGAHHDAVYDRYPDIIRDHGEKTFDGRRSDAGAWGQMQVLPSTAAKPGYGVRPAQSQTMAEYNRVGADLSRAWLNDYGPALGAAAYNWGPGKLERALRRYGDPRKGEISERAFLRNIPGDVQNYVNRVVTHLPSGETRLASAGSTAGLFDDLPDVEAKATAPAGLFDDLPDVAPAEAQAAAPLGLFDDLPDVAPEEEAPREMPKTGVMPGVLHLNDKIAPKVPKGAPRPLAPGEWIDNPPKAPNEEGGWSSEITNTVQSGVDPRLNHGRATILPGMWIVDGKPVHVDEDTAIEYALQSGLPFKSYNSNEEAEKASQDREDAWQTIEPKDAGKVAPLWMYPAPVADKAGTDAAKARTAHGEGLPLLSPEAQQTFEPKQPKPLSPLGQSLGVTPEERNTPLGVVALNRLKSGASDYAAQYANDVGNAWTNLTTDLQAAVPDRDKMKAAKFWDATKMQVDSYLATGKSIGDAFALALAPLTAAAHLGTKAQGDFYHALVPSIDPKVVKDAFDRAIIGIGPAKPVPNPAADAFSSATARAFNGPLRLTDQRAAPVETPTVKALPAPDEPPPGIPTAEVPAHGLAAAAPPQGIGAAIPLPDLAKPAEATEPPVPPAIFKKTRGQLPTGGIDNELSVLPNLRRMGGIRVYDAQGNLTKEGADVIAAFGGDPPQGVIAGKGSRRGVTADNALAAFRANHWFMDKPEGGTLPDFYNLIGSETPENPIFHPHSDAFKKQGEKATKSANAQALVDIRAKADELGIPWTEKSPYGDIADAIADREANPTTIEGLRAKADKMGIAHEPGWDFNDLDHAIAEREAMQAEDHEVDPLHAEHEAEIERRYERFLNLYGDPLTAREMANDPEYGGKAGEVPGVPETLGVGGQGAEPAARGAEGDQSPDPAAEAGRPVGRTPAFHEEPGAVDAQGKALPQTILPGMEQGDAKAQQAATKASRALDKDKLLGQQSKLRKGNQEAPSGMFAEDKQADIEGTRAAPVTVTAADHMEPARAAVNTEPTEAQKDAGNYAKGHLKYQGHDVTLETPKGSERTGVGKDGKPWSVTMPADYGYIKRTEAADGEQLDVYLGPKPDAAKVYIIDQVDLDTGKFDEHKAMMGFGSLKEARATYAKAFSDGKGGERIGGVRTLTPEQFKRYVKEGDLTKPASPFTQAKAKKPRRATGGSVERTPAMAEPDDDLDGFTRVTPQSLTPAPKVDAADVNDMDGFTRSSEPPQTTWGSAGKNFGAGAAEAATSAAAMFSDPGALEEMGALGLHPDVMPEGPEMRQHRLNEALGPANPENIKANTALERIARGAGAGAAGALLPGGLPTKLATAGKEILINTLAGAGASAAEELAPDALKPVAGVLGGVGTSLATAPREMLSAAERAGSRLTVRGRAGQRLVSEASDPDVAMSRLGTEGAIVPGSMPTAGQESRDTGLLTLEHKMKTRDRVPFKERQDEQSEARRAELDKLQTEGSSVNLAEYVKNHIQQIDKQTEQDIADVTTAAQRHMDSLGGEGTPEQYGAALRKPLEAARKRAKAREDALWAAVDPNKDLTINADPLRRTQKDIVGNLEEESKPPAGEERRILDLVGKYGQTVPFSKLIALRTSLNDALRTELRTAGKSQVYARLSKMRGAVEDSLSATIEQRAAEAPDEFANLFANFQQQVPGQAFDQAARERLTAASEATKARARTYDKGSVGQITRQGDTADQYRLSDAGVPAKVFMPGAKGAEAVAAYRKAAGDGQALADLQDYAASSLRKAAERPDGTLDPVKAAAWAKRHSEAMRAFPALQKRFGDAASASEAIAEAALNRRTQMDAAQAGAFGRIAKIDSPSDIANTVGGIFSAKDSVAQMRGLVGRVKGDPDALEGLRKAVADHINTNFVGNTTTVSGVAQIKSDAFQTFVKKNEAALREVFSPEQVKSLQAISRDLERSNQSITAPKITGFSGTASDTQLLGQGASFLRRLVEHSGPWGYAGSKVIGALHSVGLDRTDKMVREALLNPKFAKELMSRVPKKSPGSDAMLAARFRRSLLPTAAAVYSGSGGESQP